MAVWTGTWSGTWFGPWLGPLTAFEPPEEWDTPLERTVFLEALQFSQIVEPIQFSFEVDLLEFVFDLHEDEMTIKFPYKDPDETQDYELDWTARLDALPTADDTIDSSSWSIVTDMSGHAAPLVIEAIQKSDNETRVWLSGGTTGEKYELLNRVTTTAGRIMDQTCELKIKER